MVSIVSAKNSKSFKDNCPKPISVKQNTHNMNAMLQRHNAKFIYTVPDGLRELMSDISREVLRSQPKHTYTFIADYLDALLITRENARIAARLVENIAEIATTIASFLERTGMKREEVNKTVAVLQTAFRKYLSVKPKARPNEQVEEEEFITDVMETIHLLPEKAEEAVIVIQNAYKQFKERQERQSELLKGMIDWRIAARSAIYLYKKTGVTAEEANRAATLIKAAYKGYYTRRTMQRISEQSNTGEVESEEMAEEEEEWFEGPYEEYLKEEENNGYEEEQEKIEEVVKPSVEIEEVVIPKERSGLIVSENLMKQILDCVVQTTESDTASGEATTTDLEEGGDTIGGETTEATEI